MSDKKTVLEVKNLVVEFNNYDRTTRIIHGIDFRVNAGETVGIIGESGCGKSMTSLAIMGLIPQPGKASGEINFHGDNLLNYSAKQMNTIRGDRISMIFQEPMTALNPVFTIGNQLIEVFRTHQRCSKAEAKKKAIEALKMVKIAMPEQRMNEYPHQLSGGMRQRVMIAMALASNPEVLIADEPTTALDVTIQAQILELMKELKEELGTALILITHDLGVVSEVCSRIIILYCGLVVEEASGETIFKNPRHPYTEGLLKSLPRINVQGHLYVIPGTVPSANEMSVGCVFNPRCQYATDRCRHESPPLFNLGNGCSCRCWKYEKDAVEEKA